MPLIFYAPADIMFTLQMYSWEDTATNRDIWRHQLKTQVLAAEESERDRATSKQTGGNFAQQHNAPEQSTFVPSVSGTATLRSGCSATPDLVDNRICANHHLSRRGCHIYIHTQTYITLLRHYVASVKLSITVSILYM